MTHSSCLRAPRAQRGFSLFIVLIMLLLSALLAVGGARMAQLLESVAGNQREHQRAFEAAEAALLDAERDILRQREQDLRCVFGTRDVALPQG